MPAYGAALALLFLTAAAGTALFALKKEKTKRSALIRGLVVGAAYVGVLSLVTFLINNVIFGGGKPWIAALTTTGIIPGATGRYLTVPALSPGRCSA